MRFLRVIHRRLLALARRDRLEQEMDDELSLHFDLAVEDRISRGLSPARARAEVLREFGGRDGARESYRDAGGTQPFERLLRDFRYAWRTLRATPVFTLIVVGTLALGIGANSAIFSVVNGVLLRALPYADPERLVMVWETDRDSGTEREGASVPDYFDFRERARSFDHLAAFQVTPMNRTGAGEPERVAAARVSADFLATMGSAPLLGRNFLEAEAMPGGPRAMLVSERYWRSQLGADPRALGQSLRLDDSLFTIVGVLPVAFRFPEESVDLWIADQLTPESGPRYRHQITVVGRLAAGTSVDAAQREMDAIASALEAEYPQTNAARGVNLEPVEEALFGPIRPALLLLLAAVGVVLVISCVNAANLLLARRAARTRELAVRTALGAGRSRLVQQLLVESALIAAAAALVGIALAFAGVRGLLAVAPAAIPRVNDIAVDGTVLAVTLGISAVVAVVFGLLPVGGGQRVAPADALKSSPGRTGSGSREHRRLRATLVITEIALAVVLVVGAGLIVRSFWALRSVEPGFVPENMLSLRYQLPPSRYPQSFADYPGGWARIFTFQRELLERVEAIPGVRSAALAFNDPLSAGFTNSFLIEGRDPSAAAGQPEVPTRPASANYFATAGIPLLQGRSFTPSDDAGAPPVVIINAAMARQFFANENPLGRRLTFWGVSREIVGVVGNERFAGLASDPAPAMYPALAQAPATTGTLIVRTAGDPRAILGGVRAAIRSIDRDLAPFGITTMGEALDASVARERFLAFLLAAFAALALVLALVGVYGVVSYSVAQRGREIGIRLALGASSRLVLRSIVGEGLRLAIAGCAIGVVGALGAARLVRSQLFGVSAADPLTIAAAVATMAAVAVAASLVPALRASTLPPAEVLRDS